MWKKKSRTIFRCDRSEDRPCSYIAQLRRQVVWWKGWRASGSRCSSKAQQVCWSLSEEERSKLTIWDDFVASVDHSDAWTSKPRGEYQQPYWFPYWFCDYYHKDEFNKISILFYNDLRWNVIRIPILDIFFLDRNAKLQGTRACVPRDFQGLALSAIVTVITRSTYCTLPFLLNPTSPDDVQAPCYRGRAVQWLKRQWPK